MPVNHENTEYQTNIAALCAKLGQDLKAARNDDDRVQALFVEAVRQFMEYARAAGADPNDQPGYLGCAETLRDGGGPGTPSPFELADATDDEFTRWGDMLADAAGY